MSRLHSISSREEDLDLTQAAVLVADDQESITQFMEQVLRVRVGCKVYTAQTGDEAIARLENTPIDVLVTDMRMPGLHGLELLRSVRDRFPKTGIIVITGYPEDFPYVEVMHAGADDFIRKPFPQGELEAKLIRLLREQQIQRARALAESKYRSLFELSAEGMVLLDAESNVILDANKAFHTLLGLEPESLEGEAIGNLFPEADRARMEQWLQVCSRRGGGTMADIMLSRDAGAPEIHLDVTASFIAAELGRIVFLTFKDITEKREVEQRLAEAAQKDALTGLFNKRSFQSHLAGALARAASKNRPVCLLMIDLDNFKQCNDKHGHQVGDRLLSDVGKVVQKSIRGAMPDEGFRYGGDEFSIILHETSMEGGVLVAQRMQSEYDHLERYGTTMSIGIAECMGELTPEAFVRMADAALYQAKNSGRNAIRTA